MKDRKAYRYLISTVRYMISVKRLTREEVSERLEISIRDVRHYLLLQKLHPNFIPFLDLPTSDANHLDLKDALELAKLKIDKQVVMFKIHVGLGKKVRRYRKLPQDPKSKKSLTFGKKVSKQDIELKKARTVAKSLNQQGFFDKAQHI